jgi:hypothetical protein
MKNNQYNQREMRAMASPDRYVKSSIARILLESVTFAPNTDVLSDSGSVEFTLSHDRRTPIVRLTATGTGDYAFSITFAAEVDVTPDAGEPVSENDTEAMLRRAASVLLSHCESEITHLTLHGRFGPWTFDPVDVDALVNLSPEPLDATVSGKR